MAPGVTAAEFSDGPEAAQTFKVVGAARLGLAAIEQRANHGDGKENGFLAHAATASRK
ncbi:hypothetical protein D3C87_1987270 [compost metagenome]